MHFFFLFNIILIKNKYILYLILILHQVICSSIASRSNSKVIDHFVGMGFSEKMVARAVNENGKIYSYFKLRF